MKNSDQETVMMETVLSELQLIVPQVETIINLINNNIDAKVNSPNEPSGGLAQQNQFVLEGCFSFLEEHLQKLAQISQEEAPEKPFLYIVE